MHGIDNSFQALILIFNYSPRRPPHQIMTWVGLERYGYLEEAQRLAYRFLYMFVSIINLKVSCVDLVSG